MKKLRAAVCLLLVLTIFSTQASAWSNPGHMAIAGLAYKKLNDATKQRVDELVAKNPMIESWNALIPASIKGENRRMRLFMIAATWPDQIKSAKGYHADGLPLFDNKGNPILDKFGKQRLDENSPPTDGTADNNIGYDDKARHKYWHFIDMAFSQDGATTPAAPDVNAEERINAFRKVLKDQNASDDLKSYDLVWLLHLIGDIHQPLHGAERYIKGKGGDGGGNGVKIKVCDEDGKCDPGSLHGYWDGIFGSTTDLKQSLTLALKAINQALKTVPAGGDDLDTDHWVMESFNAAKTTVYHNPPIAGNLGVFTITAAYRDNAITLGNIRLALAASRLQKVLETELK
jgi:hypothetical protein